jgi:hypothetical protein
MWHMQIVVDWQIDACYIAVFNRRFIEKGCSMVGVPFLFSLLFKEFINLY